ARPGRLDWFIAPEPERGALGAVRLDRVRLRSRGDGGPLHSAVDRRRLHVLRSRDGGQWHRLGDGGLRADRACRDRHGDANTIAEPVADTVPITLTVALTFTQPIDPDLDVLQLPQPRKPDAKLHRDSRF